MSDTKSRPPLYGFHRRTWRSRHRAVVRPNITLPDVAELKGATPELVAMIRDWNTLDEQQRHHARESRKAVEAADAADQARRQAVREALTAGKPEPKDTGIAQKHRDVAKAHQDRAEAAQLARERLGFDLAPKLEEEAATLIIDADQRTQKLGDTIAAELDKVEADIRTWRRSLNLRTWLSWTDLNGGSIANYDENAKMPDEITEALAALRHAVAALDRLRHDEAQVREFRAENPA